MGEAKRLVQASVRLRNLAEAAQRLEWDAVTGLERVGFSDSTVALAVADLLDERHYQHALTRGVADLSHEQALAAAILGDHSRA